MREENKAVKELNDSSCLSSYSSFPPPSSLSGNADDSRKGKLFVSTFSGPLREHFATRTAALNCFPEEFGGTLGPFENK